MQVFNRANLNQLKPDFIWKRQDREQVPTIDIGSNSTDRVYDFEDFQKSPAIFSFGSAISRARLQKLKEMSKDDSSVHSRDLFAGDLDDEFSGFIEVFFKPFKVNLDKTEVKLDYFDQYEGFYDKRAKIIDDARDSNKPIDQKLINEVLQEDIKSYVVNQNKEFYKTLKDFLLNQAGILANKHITEDSRNSALVHGEDFSYEGPVAKNKKTGQRVFSTQNGQKALLVKYRDNKPQEIASIYYGEFKGGIYNGRGLLLEGESITSGLFKKGQLLPDEKRGVYSDGTLIVSESLNSSSIRVTAIKPNGEILSADYEDGKKVRCSYMDRTNLYYQDHGNDVHSRYNNQHYYEYHFEGSRFDPDTGFLDGDGLKKYNFFELFDNQVKIEGLWKQGVMQDTALIKFPHMDFLIGLPDDGWLPDQDFELYKRREDNDDGIVFIAKATLENKTIKESFVKEYAEDYLVKRKILPKEMKFWLEDDNNKILVVAFDDAGKMQKVSLYSVHEEGDDMGPGQIFQIGIPENFRDQQIDLRFVNPFEVFDVKKILAKVDSKLDNPMLIQTKISENLDFVIDLLKSKVTPAKPDMLKLFEELPNYSSLKACKPYGPVENMLPNNSGYKVVVREQEYKNYQLGPYFIERGIYASLFTKDKVSQDTLSNGFVKNGICMLTVLDENGRIKYKYIYQGNLRGGSPKGEGRAMMFSASGKPLSYCEGTFYSVDSLSKGVEWNEDFTYQWLGRHARAKVRSYRRIGEGGSSRTRLLSDSGKKATIISSDTKAIYEGKVEGSNKEGAFKITPSSNKIKYIQANYKKDELSGALTALCANGVEVTMHLQKGKINFNHFISVKNVYGDLSRGYIKQPGNFDGENILNEIVVIVENLMESTELLKESKD